jgi:hypothetical protein
MAMRLGVIVLQGVGGVGVEDAHGKLIGAVSNHDFYGLILNPIKFRQLNEKIASDLFAIESSKKPLQCASDTTLEDCLRKITQAKAHRWASDW